MRPLFNKSMVDEATGRIVIGRESARACPYCGHEPVATVSEDGRVELWHAPTNCCRRSHALNARLAASTYRDPDEDFEA